MPLATTELYDLRGRRKYLNHKERIAFRKAAQKLPKERKLFCLVLLYTGCRISEALQLTGDRIDLGEGVLTFRTLKQRDEIKFRPVPLQLIYQKELLAIGPDNLEQPIWSFSRTTGWRIIKSVMREAGIEGAQDCPKGLRHGFGVACALKKFDPTFIRDLLGHSSLKTTAIYLKIIGEERKKLVAETWV